MISNEQLETRIFDYLNTIIGNNATNYGFSTVEGERYLIDRQTNAPRVNDGTVIYYRVENNNNRGLNRGSTRNVLDPETDKEYIELWKDVHVIVNILSQTKGQAKDATTFLMAVVNSERDYKASYGILPFDLILYKISKEVRNLTDLETNAWQERIEFDMYFNYRDIVDLDDVQWINQPTIPSDVPDNIDWETTLKQKV